MPTEETDIKEEEQPVQEKRTNPLNYLKEIAGNPRDFLTIPNMLVYLRIALSILFLVIYMIGVKVDYSTHAWSWGIAAAGSEDSFQIEGYLACAIILTCGFTDFLDGYIARKFNQRTQLGLLLDPVADKLLQLFIVIGVCYRWYQVSWTVWMLLAILLVKEGSMIGCNIAIYVLHGFHFQKAYWYGKVSTVVLYVTMGVMLFFVGAIGEYDNVNLFITILCSVCSGVLLFAFVMYMIQYADMFKNPDKYRNQPRNEEKQETEESSL